MTDDHAAGGADRLRALFGKLRHPLVEVRRRAISNIDGKLSLGLMIPDELESDPALFAGVVALLSELAASWSSGRAPTSSEDVSGPLLSLCTRLAKAPSCKARLAGQGAHVPLSKIASAPELPRELRALAAEALALVEESPYAEAEAAAVIPNSENRNPGTEDFGLAPLPTSDAAAEDVTSVDAEGEGAGEALAVTEACFLDGVGSGTRWPRWTKDLVDGPSLQAKDASAETLVASLRAGWRFPPVRLIRSEESALFDLEVRFRTANTEASLLGCVELLRDEIMEDYPSEVLLQRPGIIGRLAALLRTPSASERILEEALSTAKRLLERLVYSARMHLDDAFLPPRNSETGTLSASEGVVINEREGAADDFNHLGGTNLSTHGLFGEEALLRRGTGRHGPGPAEAAVATLLSFRYPQSSIKWSLASQEEDDAALGALPEKGLTRGRRRGNGPRDDAGSGDGLSFCGALFALFLSACPLLGCGVSPSGGGNGSDVVGPGTGGMDGSALGGDRSHAVPVVGARGGGDLPAVVPSKVALSTAELLQAMTPLLLEPLLTAQLASSAPPFPSTLGVDPPHGGGGGWKMTGAEAPRVSRLVDAFRMQELLCSLGRVLEDSIGARSAAQHVRVRGAGGNLGNQGRTLEDHGLRASAVPHPARSVALRLLLVITPSDLTGDCDDPLSLTLPSEYVSLVRAVAMDPVLAEEQPWLRERLRSYLSVADPEEAALLEEAQLLTRDAESVLEVDAGAVVDTDERGPGDAWEWAAEQLRKVRRALPLARAVDEPRIVGAALTLWSAAAAATVNAGSFPDSRSMAAASGGPRSLDPHRPGQERVAVAAAAAAAAAAVEQLGAAILLDLVRGAFGERACCQTLCMLEEVVGVETAIGKGGVAVPSGLAEAMVSRGLPDPRQLSPSATSRRRSVAALTVFAGALTSPHNSDGSSDGRRGKKRNERERRVTSYGCVSSGMVRSTRSLSPSPSQSPPSASASATALMAALLQRAASAAPGKVTRDEEVANPVSLTSSPGQSSAAYYGGSGTVVGDGSDGGSSSGSDAHGNAVADGVAASASVSARRIVGWSCAELHTLLLSAREEATDGVDISRRWRRGGRSNGLRDGAENRAVVRDISAATAGVAATAAFRLAPTLEAFLCCCGERIAEENRRQRAPVRLDSAENFRELSRVVSSLLEFLDAFWCPTGMAWGSVMRGAEDVCVSPHVSKMLREVRGLCRGRAEDRASASRGLMGLLLEAPGGRERTNTPLVYTEDPLLLTQDDADFPWGQGSMARRHPAADPSIGAGVSNGRFALPSGSGSGSKPSFTADHVRNLAKVAASETLEPGLRRAAAEQLGAVLESPGVNAAVVSEDGCREKEAPLENLCAAVLRSALSGLLGPSYRKVNVPPPSPDTSLTSSHTNTSAPANASTAGSAEWPATADFRHDHRWEEAFLGLLRSAVWKLPSARLALLTPSPPPATHDADASTTASASSEVEAEVSVAVAVAAVLRRLYHPRPSVRRLASRVAIRMAFDPAVMFSPLLAASSPSMRGVPACSGCGEGVGTSERLQVETVAEGAWTRNCSGHARDGESRGAVARGSTDRWGPSVDGFRVPPMVLRAYPRLGEWATICSRRGDLDGCRDVSTLETSMLTVEEEQGGGNASRCDGRRDGRIRNCSDWYCGLGSRPDHCGGVIALASAEWQVLRRRQHRRKRPGEGQGEGGGESSSPRGDAAAPEAVANRLAEALRGASRRSQFLSAMAGARAWMLAGENYSEAFFGRGAVWRSAFERFLHTPPRSVKDRVALRNVLIFLKAGTAWMCPRGLDVLATMAEECFVPVMSEEWRPSVLENLSGDWKPPSRGESPKELEAKHRLQETVLELLVAVIDSPRLGTEAAQSLAVSSLPKVLWKEVLEENGGGNSWGQAEGRGKGSARLRRLAVTFLTGIVRRCEAFATSAWASVVTQGPKTSNDGFGFGGGNGEGEGVGRVLGQASKTSTKGSGDGQDLSPSVLLTELIESLVRRASGHHSPDGFRGRASLTASLVALQTILATAAATIPAEVAATGTSEEAGPLWNPTRCSRDFDRVVALLLRGNGLNGGRRGDTTGRTSRETGTVIRTRTALPSAPDATNSLAHGESQTQRLAWLLGLSCHRDSAVRALAFSVLAEIPPRVAAPRPLRTTRRVEGDLAGVMRAGFAGEEAGEVVHACLRAALDGIHESPAVVTEALRFLSRHTLAFSSPTLPGAQGAPQQGGYSLPLSASLGQAAATLLLEPVRGGNRCLCCSCCFCCSTFRGSGGARGRGKKGAAGGSAAGPLALAAAQLRFVATAAAAAATASAATVGSGGVSRDGARGPLWREGRAEEEEEEKSTTAEGGGCGVAGEFVGLVEACWASGCLESCVHVLGEAPGPVGCSGQPVNGERTCQCNGGGGGSGSVGGGRDDPWGQLLAASVEEEASALRRAQADALTLLRFVCRATTLCETSAITPPPPPSRRHSSDSPSSPAIPPGNTFGDRGINTAYAKGTSENPGEGGGHDTPGVQAAAEASAAVRRVLLTKTPLLAGVVRCFMGVVASGSTALSWVAGSSAASEMARVVDPERARRELSGAARVAREACASLRCILSVDAFHAMGTPPPQQQQQQQQRGGGAYPDLGPRIGWPRIEHPYAVHGGAPVILASDLLSPGSAVPHAVLTAVGDVLRWPDGPEDARGREVAGLIVQAKTEARRLLPVMLSIPRWRNSLDLSSVEARSLAIVLFEEEVAALSGRGGSSWSERRTARADGDLRARCLVPLLESSEYLQDLALSSGLIGDLYLALENSLAEIATVGHGRDAIKNAAIHLETLKAGMRRRRRSSPSIPGAAAAPAGGGASATPPGSTRQRKTKTKPPIPIEVKRSSRSPSLKTPPTKLTSNVSSKAAEEKAEATGAGVRKLGDDRPDGSGDEVDHHDGDNENHNNGGGRTGARTPRVSPGPGARPRLRPRPKQRPSPPPASLPSASSALAPSSDRRVGVGGDTKGGGAYRFRGRDSAAGAGKDATSGGSIPAGASGAGAGGSSEVAPAGGKTASRVGATAKAVVGEGPEEERGKVLEWELYMTAALISSVVGDFPEGQAEALRVQLPQLLWKAWPVALASQLSSNSSNRSENPGGARGRGLLLPALLGMAAALAKGFPPGKRAFIFAGPEGANGSAEAGEWPRSSRSLLHRIAALALAGSPIGVGSNGEPEYGRAACEAACDVVRSCALSPECRSLLAQSGFFADAVAQIRRLCGKAGTRASSGTFMRAVGRVGDLTGVLVNASLRTEGQNALLQVGGIGDMLGDLLRLCLRAAAAGYLGSPEETSPVREPSGAGSLARYWTPPAIARALLLLRNLALAPSTGEVAAHRQPLLNLALQAVAHSDLELSRAAASCLRAVLRGGYSDGGGKTAVGIGARKAEVATAVDSRLRAVSSFSPTASSEDGGIEIDARDARQLLRSELEAVKDFFS